MRVTLAPGERRTVEFRISGHLASGSRYRLTVVDQPTLQANPVEVVVRTTGPKIEVPAGARRAADGVHIATVGVLRRHIELFAR